MDQKIGQKIVEKVNSAAFRADFTKYADRIQQEGIKVIVQRNNKDLFKCIPLAQQKAERNGSKKSA